jgi:hypothetical protein
MSFTKSDEIPCNCGHLNIYRLSSTAPSPKCWLSLKELTQVMVHHQWENLVKREEDGEVMVPISIALYLLFKMEMEDFSITPTINALKQLCKCTLQSPPPPTKPPPSPTPLSLDATPLPVSDTIDVAGNAFHQVITNTIKILPMLSLPLLPPLSPLSP